MGTRASFFIGNPTNLEKREWLGCVAWDGYSIDNIESVKTEEDFRDLIKNQESLRDDFSDPSKGGFPFPWDDDLFLTDFTWAFFDGKVQVANFYKGFFPINKYYDMINGDDFEWEDVEDNPELKNVHAPTKADISQPQGIMIISSEKGNLKVENK